jgi:acetoin utilization deacetylase AcuC-like enzyme
VRFVYSDRYRIDIGAHVFPTAKYRLVWERLRLDGLAAADEAVEPAVVSWDDLALVHTDGYLEKLRSGTLTPLEVATLEIPWSPEIVEGFRLMTGGTCEAARLAAEDGVAAHIGGGFHHAFADHGEGFCMFNDVAVAIRVLQRERRIARPAVIDCDVHHGNGTAMIFGRDPAVCTFSIHQQHNYPAFKPASTIDIGLPDGITDEGYLRSLEEGLERVRAHAPDFVFYLAGADPFREDQLGGLALTRGGLRRRDAVVMAFCAAAGAPVVATLAGGYARRVEDTVGIHVATIDEARAAEASLRPLGAGARGPG